MDYTESYYWIISPVVMVIADCTKEVPVIMVDIDSAKERQDIISGASTQDAHSEKTDCHLGPSAYKLFEMT